MLRSVGTRHGARNKLTMILTRPQPSVKPATSEELAELTVLLDRAAWFRGADTDVDFAGLEDALTPAMRVATALRSEA